MNVQAIVVPTKYPNYVAVGRNIIKSDLAPVRTEAQDTGEGTEWKILISNAVC